jgi:hypothetical protein
VTSHGRRNQPGRLTAIAKDLVITGRQIPGQPVIDRDRRAVLEADLCRTDMRLPTGTNDDSLRRGKRAAHRPLDRPDRIRRRRATPAEGVEI